MYVSPRLYVGRAPNDEETAAKHAGSARQAAQLIKQGFVVVVPTTDIAHEALLLLGSSPEHALRATGRPAMNADLLDFGGVV